MMSAFGMTPRPNLQQQEDNLPKNFINNGSSTKAVEEKNFRNLSSLVSEATTANTLGSTSPSSPKQSTNSVESQCSEKSGNSNYYTIDSYSDRRVQNVVAENNKSKIDTMLNLTKCGNGHMNDEISTRRSEGFDELLSPRSHMNYCNFDGTRSTRCDHSLTNSLQSLNERQFRSYTASSEIQSLQSSQNSIANENKQNHWSQQSPGAYSETECIKESESQCLFSTEIRSPTSSPMKYGKSNLRFPADACSVDKIPSYSPTTELREGETKNLQHSGFFSPRNADPATISQSQANNFLHKSPQSWVDYGRVKEINKLVEKRMIHEGYETRVEKIPLFRPINIIEKIVEVPVVQTVDTYVPKVEVVEVPKRVIKPFVETVEKIVEIPEIHYNDKIVEVPDVQKIVRSVPKVEIREVVKFVPKREVKVIPKYVEVPIIKICNKYKEIEEIHEVVKPIVKVQTVDVPRQVIKKVPKYVKKVIEQKRFIPVIEYRDVPVEKITYVPKVETIEKIRQIPQIINVEVPQIVHKHLVVDRPYYTTKYRDNYVFIPVRQTIQPVIRPSGKTEYVEVPLHKPYIVTHDTFKPKECPVTMTPGQHQVSIVPFKESNVDSSITPDGTEYYMKPLYPLTPQSSFHSLPNFDEGCYPSSGATSHYTNSPINSPRL